MPVRSLNSSVLKWPDADVVDEAAREWASRAASECPEIRGIGYTGSYARGDWGVGSDLDLVVIVPASSDLVGPDGMPSLEARRALDLTGLPVPADLILVREPDFERGLAEGRRFHRSLESETVWLFGPSAP